MFDNHEICSSCKGQCCKAAPGCTYPSDFNLPDETSLRAAFASGRYSLDYWMGNPKTEEDGDVYFVIPARKGYEGQVMFNSWGGECTFLRPWGCELASDERPFVCRHLEPKIVIKDEIECLACISHVNADNSRQASAIEWLPYQELLLTIRDEMLRQ